MRVGEMCFHRTSEGSSTSVTSLLGWKVFPYLESSTDPPFLARAGRAAIETISECGKVREDSLVFNVTIWNDVSRVEDVWKGLPHE